MESSQRRRLLMARRLDGRDVLPGEFVQRLWGGPTGFLLSVENNGTGLVHWLNRPGHNQIIHTSHLKQAEQRP